MAYNVGLVGPYDFDGVVANDYFASLVNFLPNRTPMVARLPNRPINGLQIKAIDDEYRPLSCPLKDGSGITNSATAITVDTDNGLYFKAGDVIQVDSELFLVTSSTATVLTVVGGHAGTTRASHALNATIYLVGNTRTGSEVDQDGNTRLFDTSITYPQTVQHPYQVGGSTEASSPNMAIPTGLGSFLGYQRAKASQDLMDDFERSIYYGQAVAYAADGTRPMMRGMRQRLATNRTTAPTAASAYKPSDFERDFIQPAYDGGGQPDLLVLSNNYRLAFQIWGLNLTQLNPGATALGVDFQTWISPDLGGLAVLFAPLLRPFTGFCLTSNEVYMGWKREPFDKPRGSRGDAFEGDCIGEGTLIVNNEKHHAWVEGVTAFAKQS